jgi:2EXR family
MDEFHFFPKLSAEIQLEIWKYAAFIPRVVVVACSHPQYHDHSWTGDRYSKIMFTSPTPVPAMLAACFTARQVGLKYYQLTFGTEEREACIYLNFEVDTVYMKAPTLYCKDSFHIWHYACHYLTRKHEHLLTSIRSFAIDVDNILISQSSQIAEMTGLRELLIIDDSIAPTTSYHCRPKLRPNPARVYHWIEEALVRRGKKILAAKTNPGSRVISAPLTLHFLELGEDGASFVERGVVGAKTIENFPFCVFLPFPR